jgi:hypothetical protein
MKTGFTAAELRRAQSEGAKIMAYDTEVEYKPSRDRDVTPWRALGSRVRYRSTECRPVEPRGGGPWAVARLIRF